MSLNNTDAANSIDIQKSPSSDLSLHYQKNKDLAIKQAIFWAFMFGLGECSFGIFADHIKVPLWFYAALIWIPNFIGPFVQIVSANILEKYNKRVFLIYLPVLIQATSLVPIAFLAYWQSNPDLPEGQATIKITFYIFLVSVFLYYLSTHFAAPLWQSLVGDFLAPDERGRFFGKFNRVVNLFTPIAMIMVWLALYIVEKKFNNNYFIVSAVFAGCFFLAFIGRVISGLTIKKMEDLPYQAAKEDSFTFWQFIKRAPISNFVKFVLFMTVIQGGTNIAGPYYLDYWRNTLKLSASQWLVLQVFGITTTMITSMAWGRFADLFGNKRVLQYSVFLISLSPLSWMFFTNFYLLLSMHIIGMIFWTGFNLSTVNYIYDAASQTKRARCFAYYSLITGAGMFIGTQIGLFIMNYFTPKFFSFDLKSNFIYVLFFSIFIRLIACIFLLPRFKELREIKPFGLQIFWKDVLQFSNLLPSRSNRRKSN